MGIHMGSLGIMCMQIRSMKGAEKKRCQGKSLQYRNDLTSLRRAFDQARSRASQQATGYDTAAATPAATREQRLQAADDSLARTGVSLEDSRRVLAETEDIGADVVRSSTGRLFVTSTIIALQLLVLVTYYHTRFCYVLLQKPVQQHLQLLFEGSVTTATVCATAVLIALPLQ
jgi:hypothetical protein